MNSNNYQINLSKTIPEELNKIRLDIAIAKIWPEYSRSKIQEWIKLGYVTIDGKVLLAKNKVQTNQTININALITAYTNNRPQSINLDIIYEDKDIIVINKPIGLVVHPGAGQPENTLLNALLYKYPELVNIPRAGIIHRLDKDTSGLLVVARNLISHKKLITQLQQHKITREYEAITYGMILTGGTIEAPIGRNLFKRTHMAVVEKGKPATTYYRIIKQFPAHTHLKVMLKTGRTHQIRVHLAHIGYPIVGDQTYGKGIKIPPKCSDSLRKILMQLKHQALCATHLGLIHPSTNKEIKWSIPLPKDFEKLLKALATK